MMVPVLLTTLAPGPLRDAVLKCKPVNPQPMIALTTLQSSAVYQNNYFRP